MAIIANVVRREGVPHIKIGPKGERIPTTLALLTHVAVAGRPGEITLAFETLPADEDAAILAGVKAALAAPAPASDPLRGAVV